jgi:hypothetical protein
VRAFRSSGAPAGPEFIANTYTTEHNLMRPGVAIDDSGHFVVTWRTVSDGDYFGVSARLFLPSDVIFGDSFETGNVSAWTDSSNDGGDLSVTPAAALASPGHGLQALVDDTAALYVQDSLPGNEDRYRARFYFDPNGFDPGEAQSHFRTRIFIAFEEDPTRRLLAIVLRRRAGQYGLMGRVRLDDNTRIDTGFVPVTDDAHYVEIDWQRSRGPDALDGSFELAVDGAPVSTLTGLDNSRSAVDSVRMGALSVKAGAAGTLHLDEFDSRRRSLIGP